MSNRCNGPYCRGTGIVCGCNTRCCPPPICNNVKALFSFFSSSCTEITIFETDIRCEDGELRVYRRYITLSLRDWALYDVQEGCCISPSSSSL